MMMYSTNAGHYTILGLTDGHHGGFDRTNIYQAQVYLRDLKYSNWC